MAHVAISRRLLTPAAPAQEDVSVILMEHPTKGRAKADSRSVKQLESVGFKRVPAVTAPTGKSKKG